MISSANNGDTESTYSQSNGSGGRLLLRNASQSSLDESSQKPPQASGRGGQRERSPYRDGQHACRSLEVMQQLRSENVLCDVVLVAEGAEISAHKLVLAASSPYFCAMFKDFEERTQDRIAIHAIDPEALRLLVDYAYSAEVYVTEENVQSLLPAANILQLTAVRDACCDFLQSQLHPSNCLGIRAFADLHGCQELFGAAQIYVEKHFDEVIECDEFMALKCPQVCQLISSDRLAVSSEEKVFECVIEWVRYDLESRQENLPELMEHVRLPLLSKDYLVQRVEEEPLLKLSSTCKDYLIEALKYHLLRDSQKRALKSVRTRPRQPIGSPKVMLVVGGQAPKAIRSVECYDFAEGQWTLLQEMPIRRCRAGLAVIGNEVLAVGGFNGSLRIRAVDSYDPSSDMWSPMPPMEARRSTLGVAVLNGLVYAIGGFDGSTGLSSGEVYDPKSGEWKPIASMSTRRSSVGVGVIGNLLYAVGGYDGASRQCLNTVECYCPESNTWTMVAEMSARRSGAGVGVCNGLLYAVGGHDGPLVRNSVDVYNPEKNVWYPVADMACCRRNAGVVAVNGLLYVVGGDDGTSNLSTVEVYNPETDAWTMLPHRMRQGRSYAGVAIIDKPDPQ